jgi:hypothetical protein
MLPTLLWARAAIADDDTPKRAEARAAYERGTHLLETGDDAGALGAFVDADTILPSAQALEAAALAADRAKPTAALDVLCRRIEERTLDATARDRARAACERSGLSFGALEVSCAQSCDPRVDGSAIGVGIRVALAAGKHLFTEGQRSKTLEIRAHQTVTETIAATTPPGAVAKKPISRDSKPLAPGWFVGGVVVTAALGAGAIASGVDTAAKHGRFVDERCASARGQRSTSDAACDDLASTGSRAATRTNVLAGVTAGVGLATALVGIFAVRWSSPERSSATISVGPTRASLDVVF